MSLEKKRAIVTIIRPVLEYGCNVSDPHLQRYIKALETIQRRATRFVKDDYDYQSDVTDMIEELDFGAIPSWDLSIN